MDRKTLNKKSFRKLFIENPLWNPVYQIPSDWKKPYRESCISTHISFQLLLMGQSDPSHDAFIFPKFGAIIQSGVK